MGDSNKNIKRELNLAVKNALHAQEYINLALNTVEKNENKQLIQNTLNNINITGKNILKDNSEINITDIFSSQQSDDEVNNHILNSNLNNGNIIK